MLVLFEWDFCLLQILGDIIGLCQLLDGAFYSMSTTFLFSCQFFWGLVGPLNRKILGKPFLLILWVWKSLMAPWCSGCHYCTTPFNQAWTQVLCRFKPCSRRVGDSRWWRSLTMVLAGNKAKRLSSVNHTTKTNHHLIIIIIITLQCECAMLTI